MSNRIPVSLLILLALTWMSCATLNKNYTPLKQYPQEGLRQDYNLLRSILESKHPSLYWFTSKDSMNWYFDRFYRNITDSMTEQQFTWRVLAPLVDKIHCGHTSVSFSKQYVKWMAGKKTSSFPVYVKVWNDTMAVIATLDRKDSIFKRGTLITSVNGISNRTMIRTMFDFLPEDGHANNINFIRMSANFPYYHRNIFGLSDKYRVSYIDNLGEEKFTTVPLFTPKKDTTKKDTTKRALVEKVPRTKKLLQYRSLEIDSSNKFATITLNSFTRGHLRRFFRRSFRQLKEKNINALVIDVRNNGGGKVGLSTLFTKYISRHPFRVADTLFAKSQTVAPYGKYIKGHFLNTIELLFISKKRADGLYHNRWLERKIYHPKRNAFANDVYVITNGPTFSAAALFCNAVKGQPGIKLVGEETGGGWYGNSGIMIPDITLPLTRVRIRLPLFRLVQYNHIAEKGSGILPDIYVGTSYDALLKSYDKKMQVIKEIISAGGIPALRN